MKSHSRNGVNTLLTFSNWLSGSKLMSCPVNRCWAAREKRNIGERRGIIMCQPFFDHRENRRSSEQPSNRSHHPPLRSLSPFLAWQLIALCCVESISNSARADGIARQHIHP